MPLIPVLQSWIQSCAWQHKSWDTLIQNIFLWCLSLTDLLTSFLSSIFRRVCLQTERLSHKFLLNLFPTSIKRDSTSLNRLCLRSVDLSSQDPQIGQIIVWLNSLMDNFSSLSYKHIFYLLKELEAIINELFVLINYLHIQSWSFLSVLPL